MRVDGKLGGYLGGRCGSDYDERSYPLEAFVAWEPRGYFGGAIRPARGNEGCAGDPDTVEHLPDIKSELAIGRGTAVLDRAMKIPAHAI